MTETADILITLPNRVGGHYILLYIPISSAVFILELNYYVIIKLRN